MKQQFVNRLFSGILLTTLVAAISLAQSQTYVKTGDVRDNLPKSMKLTRLAASPQLQAALAKRISLNFKDVALQDAIREISEKAGVVISYSDLLPKNRRVILEREDISVSEALGSLLTDTELDWTGEGNSIVLLRKEVVEQETGTIGGKVTDIQSGEALPGANIIVEGTSFGSTSDALGFYRIERVPPGTYRVRASIIGYSRVSQEVTVVAGQVSNVDFSLDRAPINLDEVLVIGYGTTTLRQITGSVSRITTEEIQKQPVNNPLMALQASIPGLFITQSTGISGSGATVRIQGQTSLESGSDPLYVIDGVPYPSQMLRTLGSQNGIFGSTGNTNFGVQAGGGNPLKFLNPGDIERIDVLKDADATSIYGSQAANGAILITTKKGVAGQTRVTFNFQNGWGTVTRKLDLLNTQQYFEMRREAFANDGVTPGATDYDINGTWDTLRYTDWQKELIGGTARYNDAQVSLSGGDVHTQFLVSTAYHRETTVFPGDLSDQKGSLHFNLNNASFNQKLRLQLSGDYIVDKNQLPGIDLTDAALRLAPNAPPLYNPDGTLNWAQTPGGSSTWENPLLYLKRKNIHKTTNVIANGSVSYEVFTDATIKTSFGYNNLEVNETATFPLEAQRPESRFPGNNFSGFGSATTTSWIVEPQATYRLTLGDGRVDALLGTTFRERTDNSQNLFAYGYSSDLLLEDITGAASLFPWWGADIASVYRYAALFGRINYIYQDKYILNLTARRDGSSRFGSENRFHTFGSVGSAWIFSEEDFIKESLPFLSFGKLRASYGTTGNDQIADYLWLPRYNSVSVAVPYQGNAGLEPADLPNPYLQWEETKKLQFGLDVGVFSDRIFLNVNYYRNRSSNLLQSYSLPAMTGTNSIRINFPATVQNTGWEFSLNTANFLGDDFRWSSAINLTLPRNELIEYPNLPANFIYFLGEPLSAFQSFHFLGVDPTTGLYQFATANGTVSSTPSFTTDRVTLLNSEPKLYGGFQNTFRFMGLQLDVLFQFVKQTANSLAFGMRLPGRFRSTGGIYLGNQPVWVMERWQKPGDVSNIQKFSTRYLSAVRTPHDRALSSDGVWTDASYIRLKNLSLSWQFPYLENCLFFLRAQNLLTITDYKGFDPENRSTLSLPPLMVVTLGVQVTAL